MNEQAALNSGDTTADTLHRGVKLLLDTEEVTQDEAERILHGYRLRCVVGSEVVSSPALQAALLTIVNAAHRCFLGGVFVTGLPGDAPLLLPLSGMGWANLTAAVAACGAATADAEDTYGHIPTVILGSPAGPFTLRNTQALQVLCDGWIGEVRPYCGPVSSPSGGEFVLSGVLAGALAVSECFQFLRGASTAMRRRIRRSLWATSGDADAPDAAGPQSYLLPKSLWILGLGHLGQAYVWCQMLLPYEEPGGVRVVLNDFDRITMANLSTSLLSQKADVGKKKARHLAAVLEMRGFEAVIQERPYGTNFTRADDDPLILLCGVDSSHVRRIIGKAHFPEIIEAGLGHTAEAYLTFQLHTFPASRTPEQVWVENRMRPISLERHRRSAYQDMVSRGVDQCGIVEIAGKAVGVPFVGAYVGALVIAEAIKAVMGGPRIEVVDGSLASPERTKSSCRIGNTPVINLGYQHPV